MICVRLTPLLTSSRKFKEGSLHLKFDLLTKLVRVTVHVTFFANQTQS